MKSIKKKIKGLLVCVLTLICLLGVIPVYATELKIDAEPRAALCPSCGIGTMSDEREGTWSAWTTVYGSETKCVHHAHGEDVKQKRVRNDWLGCTYCSDGSYTTYTDYRIVCRGYD